MGSLRGKRLILGISGGIAAYKSAELVRLLRAAGAEVQVAMTRSACDFITPLTMQALSGRPVATDGGDPVTPAGMDHIDLARWCDATMIAPASADFLGQLALGLADNLLAGLCLALETPLVVAPAMNSAMWQHPATQAHVDRLSERGVRIAGPAEGDQACGEIGPGRMLEPPQLLEEARALFLSGRLGGLSLLVTAGPTHEPLDPVRYLGNRSSGRMGYAVAQAAAEAGANVTLASGPTALPAPEDVRLLTFVTAEQLRKLVLAEAASSDIFVSAAAVADYRFRHVAEDKIKRSGETLRLELEPAPDVLAEVAGTRPRPFIVGFAAETSDVRANAQRKLRNKRTDMVVANRVGWQEGFGDVETELEVFWKDGMADLGRGRKERLARELIRIVGQHYHAQRPGSHPG